MGLMGGEELRTLENKTIHFSINGFWDFSLQVIKFLKNLSLMFNFKESTRLINYIFRGNKYL